MTCRGDTEAQRLLPSGNDFAMPTTALHLVQPFNGSLLRAGEDLVLQYDVPMPGATAVLVRSGWLFLHSRFAAGSSLHTPSSSAP